MLEKTAANMSGESRGRLDVPREGRLEGTSIPEIFCRVARERWSGSLIVERAGVRKVVYLRDGRIVFAASTDPEDRLGHFLVRRGEVRLSSLVEAGSLVALGRRLGQTLIEQGAMEPPAVVRAVTDQIREIVLSIFPWRDGGWRLSGARLPEDESITLDISTEDLILAGVRRVEDWRRVRRAVGGPRAIYRVRPGVTSSREGFGMIERAVIERLGTPQRIDTLCREVYAPSFAIYRAVWALHILGHLERWDPHPLQECLAEPGEGFIRPHELADLLLDLGDRGFTGVLRTFRDDEEGAIFLEAGRVQFATTSDPEQGLSGHLLRRGVISERDHELAVRRLISGKRLGRILAEDGVIDDADVERFVREQVLDVARRLVLWESGEYLIEEGLPSNEEIKLGLWAEDVVMTAYETIDRFRPVWEALSGLDTSYRLRPEYLDRLDRMSLRPEAWSIVALLSKPRTVGDVLATRNEPDFDVCRILYALERARVVERVPREERDRAPGDEVFSTVEGQLHELAEPAPVEPALSAGSPKSAAEMAPELFQAGATRPAPALPSFEAPDEESPAVDAAAPADAIESAETPEAAVPLASAEIPSAELPSAEVPTAESAVEDVHDVRNALPAEELVERKPWAVPRVVFVSGDESASVSPFPDSVCGEPSEPFAASSSPAIADTQATGADASVEEPSAEESAPPAPEPLTFADEMALAGPPIEATTTGEADVEPVAERPAASDDDETPNGIDSGWVPALDTPGAHVDEFAARLIGVPETDPDTDTGYELGEPGTGVPVPADLSAEPTRTLELPKDDVADAVEPKAPDAALLAEIERFNTRHGLLYRELQIQVGAGVANFVRACQRSLGHASRLFEGLVPDQRGTFDAGELAQRLASGAFEAPPRALLDALVDEELATVRHLLDRPQVDAIERKLAIEAP